MRHLLFLSCFLPSCILAAAQHTNIMVGNNNNPEEPSIRINPKDPRYIVAGANIRSVYYSSDTGRTWTTQLLNSSQGVYGDPAILCDTAGSFYFFHLSDPPGTPFVDRIVSQKSITNGTSWDDGTFFGLNGTKVQDKQWITVDPRNNTIYATWTQFDKYNSANPADSSHILFVKSTDGGQSWTTPLRINEKGGDCLDDDNTVEGAVPAVGPNGELYVAWAGPLGLVFDKSLDGGATWMAQDKVITSIPGGWSYNVPGIYRANGLPVTVCDRSNGPNRGTIYINWTDQRRGTDDTDVWMVKSTDGGNTWSAPIRVNDDAPGKQQFFTWMDVDQATGHLWFVFYDRRLRSDNQTDVFMARSADGGNSFKNFKVSYAPFVPSATIFFGDYNNLSVNNGIVRPIWTRMENGALSVWTALVDTARISDVITAVPDVSGNIDGLETYPNPFNNNSFVSFKLKKAAVVSITIYDMAGRQVSKPIHRKWYAMGKYVEKIDAATHHIAAGEYFFTITINGVLYSRKMIRVE